MAEITQVISTIPEAGHRGVDTRDVFVTKQEAFQDHLGMSTVNELNTYKNQVNAVAADINSGLEDMQPVLTNISNVVTVGNNIANVNTTAGAITNVNNVGNNIANVNTTAGAITNVNNVGNNIAKVNTVSTNIASVNTVSGSIANVNTIAPDITKVNTVSTNIASVNTVSGSIANVNTIAPNITKVNTVSTNIASVNTVSGSIANVNTAAANIADINSIANNITDVTYFADIYQGTKTTAPTLRNDGSALQIGDMYFHNNLSSPSQSAMMVYATGGWIQTALSTALVLDIGSTQNVVGDKTFYDGMLKVRSTDAKVGTIKLETGASGNIDVTLPNSGGTLANTSYVTTTISNDSTSSNTANKLVRRDASGNFSAGTITAALSGNASTATTLQTSRTINGVSFNGSANITVADATKLPVTGGTMTGAITAIRETRVALEGNNIDLAMGNLFTKTISGATTLTVSNVLGTGNANSFLLELTNAGSAIITWWAGVKWAGGIAPTLTASGVDIIGFYSHDGGSTWRGMLMSKDSK